MNSTLPKIFLTALTAFSLAASADAQSGYSTTFDTTEGYVPGFSLTDQPLSETWQSNDLDNDTDTASGGPNGVGTAGIPANWPVGYGSGTDNWAAVGGIFGIDPRLSGPDTVANNTEFSFPTGVSLANASDVTFDVQFAVSSAANKPDSFGWTFRAGTDQLLQILFVPGGDGGLDVVLYPNALGNPVDSTSPIAHADPNGATDDLAFDGIYDLHVAIAAGGAVTALTIGGVSYAPTYSLGVDANLITDVAATWVVLNGTRDANNYLTSSGDNAIFFNNYSLVPEPTSALFAIGLLAVTAGRRSQFRRS